jgi:hypothetical protein
MNQANEWIDATDAQPEPYKLVLALEHGQRYTLAYVGEGFDDAQQKRSLLWCAAGVPTARPKITHWQKLPELPDEVTK